MSIEFSKVPDEEVFAQRYADLVAKLNGIVPQITQTRDGEAIVVGNYLAGKPGTLFVKVAGKDLMGIDGYKYKPYDVAADLQKTGEEFEVTIRGCIGTDEFFTRERYSLQNGSSGKLPNREVLPIDTLTLNQFVDMVYSK